MLRPLFEHLAFLALLLWHLNQVQATDSNGFPGFCSLHGSGRYSSASEVIRDALRMMEEREELRETQIKHLRQQIQEGRESGAGIPADKVFDRLEAKYRKLTSEL